MQVDVARRMFSVDDYYRMGEVGILGPAERVELIDGEIVQMSQIGSRHASCVERTSHLFHVRMHGLASVRTQNPLRLNEYNEPQPDVVLARFRSDYYDSGHPTAADTLLVVEVSDTQLRFDKTVKLPIYARLGIPEVWIEDVQHDVILVFRDPSGKNYKAVFEFHRGDSLFVAAFPEIIFTVEELIGRESA